MKLDAEKAVSLHRLVMHACPRSDSYRAQLIERKTLMTDIAGFGVKTQFFCSLGEEDSLLRSESVVRIFFTSLSTIVRSRLVNTTKPIGSK